MKGTFFSKPLEWNIETTGESWLQGDSLKGTLRVINHGTESVGLTDAGVTLAHADIKKIHTRAEGALKPEAKLTFEEKEILPGSSAELKFTFEISPNSPVTDKKGSYYLGFGKNFSESQLQVKVGPNDLYTKIVGLLDTFQRFKVKEIKATKKGVEYKLIPPTSRDMANIDSLLLTFGMQDNNLSLYFDFQVKRLDTSSITTKVTKDSVTIEKILAPKEFSLGKGMIHQDYLLQTIEAILSEVKLKSVF